MEKQIKTIGVLTSGGDAPGMNAAVRAVVRTGLHKGFRMIGIQRGYNGLLNGECFEMNLRSVSNIISAGGTILYTARCLEFKTKEGQDKGAEKCRELGIDALVVIGGDGSYRGARALAHRGIPMIGLPGTIDNDIGCTDYTIGYDTAMNTALEMIDKLRDTTQSHDRCSVVEVMGRNAGYIALNVAIASGAMAVLLPEKEFDMQRDILDKIAETQKTGKRHFIIIEFLLGQQQNGCTGDRQRDPGTYRYRFPRNHSGSCAAWRFSHPARPRECFCHGLSGCLPVGAGQV